MEIRHRWHSTPNRLENLASIVFGTAFLTVAVPKVAEVSGGPAEATTLVAVLLVVPAVALVWLGRKVVAWWRHGRLVADPMGLTLVDGSDDRRTIARADLRVHRYLVRYYEAETGGSWTKPFVVVYGRGDRERWALAGDAWPMGDELWRTIGVDPGAEEEVHEWTGLERNHPGLRRFGTADTGVHLLVWMFGCMVWAFSVIGLANI